VLRGKVADGDLSLDSPRTDWLAAIAGWIGSMRTAANQ
jgi:hypothetical protein